MIEKLNKYVVIAIYALLLVTLINSCNGCRSSKDNVRLKKEVDSLNTTVKEMSVRIYDKKELDARISIEGYEISKRMLVDNNSIVRTTRRPDDVLVEYDKKIAELREKLDK